MKSVGSGKIGVAKFRLYKDFSLDFKFTLVISDE